jgi:hypothetical protein
MDEVLYVPRVTRLVSLPYFPTYHEWLGHRIDCAQCTAALAQGSDEDNLCEPGRELARAVTWDIDQQHDMAKWN